MELSLQQHLCSITSLIRLNLSLQILLHREICPKPLFPSLIGTLTSMFAILSYTVYLSKDRVVQV